MPKAHRPIAYLHDTAATYREEAKKIFKRIEDYAMFTEEVRKTGAIEFGMRRNRTSRAGSRTKGSAA